MLVFVMKFLSHANSSREHPCLFQLRSSQLESLLSFSQVLIFSMPPVNTSPKKILKACLTLETRHSTKPSPLGVARLLLTVRS